MRGADDDICFCFRPRKGYPATGRKRPTLHDFCVNRKVAGSCVDTYIVIVDMNIWRLPRNCE